MGEGGPERGTGVGYGRRVVMTRGAIACVVGALGALAMSDAAAQPDRAQTTPTTVPAVPIDTATTTIAAAVPSTTAVTLPRPESEAADPIRNLVPSIAVVPAVLTDEADRRTAIDAAMATGGTTVAVEAEPGTLCAVVAVLEPVMAEGRWEHNGEPIGSSTEERRDPPGFGECITNENGEGFREGVYQFVAVGPTGATSAAASVVVGVEAIDVWFVNNGEEPVCLVLMSPTRADYYESHDTDSPLQPGEAISISAAAVEHDVRVFGCPPDDSLRSFQFMPEPQTYADLFADDDDSSVTTAPPDSGAATAAPTTT